MKIFINFIIIFIFFSQSSFANQKGCSDVFSSLVFEEKTGNILSETRSNQLSYPASLVKLMTLYLTFEALEEKKISLKQNLTFSARGEEIAAVNKINTLKSKEGDKITVYQAIAATIVKSFNEAAVTLGEAISGSEWAFVRKMNKKARELKMYNTSFRNASGLHAEGQYTTSYDLARLTSALIRDFPQYYPLFSLKSFTYNEKKYQSHNYVLLEYKGAEGLKTGFTSASGFNLISVAKKNKTRIVSVLLGCADHYSRDDFTMELLDQAFKSNKNNSSLKTKLAKNFNYSSKKQKR